MRRPPPRAAERPAATASLDRRAQRRAWRRAPAKTGTNDAVDGKHTVRFSVDEFRAWEHKCLTLLGMSGVGKTRLAHLLRRRDWFHYSGDYRIGTRYLGEPILDDIKARAMHVPVLRDLLRSDSVYISNNITVDNLHPLSSFLGKLGNPQRGGLGLREFKRRQKLHRQAEIAAMKDVPEFIRKAQVIYGYRHFVNDAGGSVCELDDPQVLEVLARHTLILYIRATEADEQALIQRAEENPKPLYYRESFLDEQLADYLRSHGLTYVAQIDPDEFVRWTFPRLLRARLPRYEAIARAHGYVVTSADLARVATEADFLRLIEGVLEQQGRD